MREITVKLSDYVERMLDAVKEELGVEDDSEVLIKAIMEAYTRRFEEFDIEAEVADILEEEAKRRGISLSKLVSEIVRKFIKESKV